MKKILFVFAAMLMMFACGGGSTKQSTVSDSVLVDSIEYIDSTMIDTISIDWD